MGASRGEGSPRAGCGSDFRHDAVPRRHSCNTRHSRRGRIGTFPSLSDSLKTEIQKFKPGS